MATTTNYGWTTPDDTALVKDGASAIRTLGSSVDTTVKALSPGTTAGDVDYYTSSTAKARLAIGTTGQVLTVAGGVPSWATSSSGGMTLLSTTTLSGTTTSVTGVSGSYTQLFVRILNPVFNTGGQNIYLGFNSSTSSLWYNVFTSAAAAGTNNTATTWITCNFNQDNTGGGMIFSCLIDAYATSNRKSFNFYGIGKTSLISAIYEAFGKSSLKSESNTDMNKSEILLNKSVAEGL